MYNDYCSVNGYSVPGWTYVRTQTVKVTTVPATPSTENPRTTTTTSATTSSTTSFETTSANTTSVSSAAGAGGNGISSPTTVFNGPGGGQQTVPAVVTVTRVASAASRRSHLPWIWLHLQLVPSKSLLLQLASFLSSAPNKLMLVLAETAVVFVTPTPPSAGITSIFTKSVVETQGVPVRTQFVTQVAGGNTGGNGITGSGSSSGNAGTSTTNYNGGEQSGETTASGGSSNGETNGGETKGLTKLEIVGIILGIVLGFASTGATIWMCSRHGRTVLPVRVVA